MTSDLQTNGRGGGVNHAGTHKKDYAELVSSEGVLLSLVGVTLVQDRPTKGGSLQTLRGDTPPPFLSAGDDPRQLT